MEGIERRRRTLGRGDLWKLGLGLSKVYRNLRESRVSSILEGVRSSRLSLYSIFRIKVLEWMVMLIAVVVDWEGFGVGMMPSLIFENYISKFE